MCEPINIKKLAYELYKEDYNTKLRLSGVSRHQQRAMLINYAHYIAETSSNISFDDYMSEHNYENIYEPFMPYAAFITNTYLDEPAYIKDLLQYPDLIVLYENDTKQPNESNTDTSSEMNNDKPTIRNLAYSDSVNIRLLAYELYKQDYHEYISHNERSTMQKNYVRYLADNPNGISFDEYVAEHGYPNSDTCFRSYETFLTDIYISRPEYIEQLLGDSDFIELYHKDINEITNNLPDKIAVHSALSYIFKELRRMNSNLAKHTEQRAWEAYKDSIEEKYNTLIEILNQLHVKHDYEKL